MTSSTVYPGQSAFILLTKTDKIYTFACGCCHISSQAPEPLLFRRLCSSPKNGLHIVNTKASAPLPQPASRAVSKKRLSDSNNDLSYWLSQPPVARVAAVEHLRKQYSLLSQMEPTHNFEEFVKQLNACGAAYMVAGGYAVALYGYPRYTGDIDIWIDTTEQNAKKALQVLYGLGYTEREVNIEDLTTPDIIVQLGYPPNRIDLTTGMAGIDFTACWENRVIMPFGDTMANFISLDDLKKNKKSTARQQDLLDLQNLPE